jgi:mono/diheme cytochrome c family protein
MRNFVLGVVITLMVLSIGVVGLALLGFLPTRANVTAPKMESHIAMSALDNSVERHAPRLNNPVPPTDENLIAGIKIYTMNCAECHGGIDGQPSVIGRSFYPPAPNLIHHPPDDAEWHLFFVINNGVRYTGMPAWDKTLAASDIWKLTAFLSRIEKLPPTVQDFWKSSSGVTAPQHDSEGHEGHEDHDHEDHK